MRILPSPMDPGAYWSQRYTKGTIYGEHPAGFMNDVLEYIHDCRDVLVAGGGYGRNAALLAKSGIRVTNMDISEEAIRLGKEQNALSNLQFELGNIVTMVEPEKQYDAVVAIYLVSLIVETDLDAAMENMYHFLSANGKFVCNFLATTDGEYVESKRAGGTSLGDNAFLVDEGRQYMKFYTEDQAAALLRKHNFAIDRMIMAKERRFINILKREIDSHSWLAFCRKSSA